MCTEISLTCTLTTSNHTTDIANLVEVKVGRPPFSIHLSESAETATARNSAKNLFPFVKTRKENSFPFICVNYSLIVKSRETATVLKFCCKHVSPSDFSFDNSPCSVGPRCSLPI